MTMCAHPEENKASGCKMTSFHHRHLISAMRDLLGVVRRQGQAGLVELGQDPLVALEAKEKTPWCAPSSSRRTRPAARCVTPPSAGQGPTPGQIWCPPAIVTVS